MTFSYTLDRENRHLIIDEGSTEIPEGMFARSDLFDTVFIPNTVVRIGESAFENCKIDELSIPDSVEYIGIRAFNTDRRNNVPSLTSLSLGSGLKEIDDYAFGNTLITELTLPESVQSIGQDAFRFSKISELILPESLLTVGTGAFQHSQLKNIKIPSTVQSISNAFSSNEFLVDVDLSDYSSSSIPSSAFRGTGIKDITIPEGVKRIDMSAFANNNDLVKVTLPATLESIENAAFFDTALQEIDIPASVVSIGKNAFSKTNITSVDLPDHFEQNIPYTAFPIGTEFDFYQVEQTPEPTPEPEPEPTPEPTPEPEPEPDPDATRGELTEEGWTSSENSGTWSESRDAATELSDVDGFSLFVRKGVTVDTLGGNDKLIVYNEVGSGLEVSGTLKMGDGHDLIDVRITNSPIGIENSGKIDMGAGDDVIVSTTRKVVGTDTDALVNHKTINMGDGDDLIDARNGGLGGDGKIKMGKGNDEFMGFGDMKLVDGGKGTDRLRLDAGVYSVMKKGKQFRVAKGIGSVDFKSFEEVGSMWSRDDEFVDFNFNKNEFAMVVDQHGVSFI